MKVKKHPRKNLVYGNCKVYSPSGNLMYFCTEKRVNWYLNKGLAEKISDNPIEIKLLFDPKDEGHHGDEYYLTPKENKCVKCGIEDLSNLTRHHIVPYQYMKFMPKEVKCVSAFDIVLLCFEHHHYYERFADELKKELSDTYKAPVGGIIHRNESLYLAIRAAKALSNGVGKMPEDKRAIMEENLKKYTQKDYISKEDLETLSKKKILDSRDVVTHGEVVVSQITDYQKFCEMWREHFLKHLEPEHMPLNWDLKRSVYKEITKK